ncbi:Phospholipase A2-gamma, partial [Capsicum baccatum]
MQQGDNSPIGKRVASSSFILTTLVSLFFFPVAESTNNSQVRCSKTCVAENCHSLGIRYGKYCGVGWSGCPGEKPCDDLDACCKIHDECIEKNGMTNVKCHEKFKRCIKKVQKSGK